MGGEEFEDVLEDEDLAGADKALEGIEDLEPNEELDNEDEETSEDHEENEEDHEENEEDEEALVAKEAALTKEEEDKAYSDKVRKRIGREVKKTKQQEGRTREAESERDIVRNELHSAKREHAELQIKYNDSEKKRLAYQVESLKKSASVALEDGQTEEYMRLNDEMVDAKVALAHEEAVVIEVPEEPKASPDGMAQEASLWMRNNRGWINDDPAKFAKAKRLSRVLQNEGYDINDPDMYDELDARLNKKAPRKQQTANIPNQNAPVKKNGKLTLTTEDKALMRKFHLDPSKATDRQEWLAGKS